MKQFCHHKSTAETLWTPSRTSRAASSPKAAELHPHLIPKEEKRGFLIQRLPFSSITTPLSDNQEGLTDQYHLESDNARNIASTKQVSSGMFVPFLFLPNQVQSWYFLACLFKMLGQKLCFHSSCLSSRGLGALCL